MPPSPGLQEEGMEDLIDDAGEDVPSAAEMIKMRREMREVRGTGVGQSAQPSRDKPQAVGRVG